MRITVGRGSLTGILSQEGFGVEFEFKAFAEHLLKSADLAEELEGHLVRADSTYVTARGWAYLAANDGPLSADRSTSKMNATPKNPANWRKMSRVSGVEVFAEQHDLNVEAQGLRARAGKRAPDHSAAGGLARNAVQEVQCVGQPPGNLSGLPRR